MEKKIFLILKIFGVLAFLCVMYLYMAIAINWSDADWCKRKVSVETTCREKYTLWNWF